MVKIDEFHSIYSKQHETRGNLSSKQRHILQLNWPGPDQNLNSFICKNTLLNTRRICTYHHIFAEVI